MQQVSVAGALIIDPKLLTADVLTPTLDVSITLGIMNLLLGFGTENQFSLRFISRDSAGACHVLGRLVIIYAGFMFEIDNPKDVTTNLLHPHTALLKLAVPKIEERLNPSFIEDKHDVPDLIVTYGIALLNHNASTL